jgi:hypothetical protein
MVYFQAKNPNLGKNLVFIAIWYEHTDIFMTIWNNLPRFGIFSPVLICCTRKNLATLLPTRQCEKRISVFVICTVFLNRFLLEKFSQLPAQALPAKLAGIRPLDGEVKFPKAASGKLLELIGATAAKYSAKIVGESMTLVRTVLRR